eukprot:364089-Chlamydomonas_euryale.AAC.15
MEQATLKAQFVDQESRRLQDEHYKMISSIESLESELAAAEFTNTGTAALFRMSGQSCHTNVTMGLILMLCYSDCTGLQQLLLELETSLAALKQSSKDVTARECIEDIMDVLTGQMENVLEEQADTREQIALRHVEAAQSKRCFDQVQARDEKSPTAYTVLEPSDADETYNGVSINPRQAACQPEMTALVPHSRQDGRSEPWNGELPRSAANMNSTFTIDRVMHSSPNTFVRDTMVVTQAFMAAPSGQPRGYVSIDHTRSHTQSNPGRQKSAGGLQHQQHRQLSKMPSAAVFSHQDFGPLPQRQQQHPQPREGPQVCQPAPVSALQCNDSGDSDDLSWLSSWEEQHDAKQGAATEPQGPLRQTAGCHAHLQSSPTCTAPADCQPLFTGWPHVVDTAPSRLGYQRSGPPGAPLLPAPATAVASNAANTYRWPGAQQAPHLQPPSHLRQPQQYRAHPHFDPHARRSAEEPARAAAGSGGGPPPFFSRVFEQGVAASHTNTGLATNRAAPGGTQRGSDDYKDVSAFVHRLRAQPTPRSADLSQGSGHDGAASPLLQQQLPPARKRQAARQAGEVQAVPAKANAAGRKRGKREVATPPSVADAFGGSCHWQPL